MTTVRHWVHGARPPTLPAAVAPVAVGTGAAAALDQACPSRAIGALVVAVALQVGVNYANDYSDGVRGTDEHRRGPLRLVGAGLATPAAVRNAALASFAIAAVTGLWLALTTAWWLIFLGAAAIGAAWYYTGGPRPYGYRGFGELSVFVFFGLVATAGTTFVQAAQVPLASVLGGVGCGALACAILVTNNVRDLEADRLAGKRTLAVLVGDRRSRVLYVALVVLAHAVVLVLSLMHPWVLLALPSALLLLPAIRRMLGGAQGEKLVVALKATAAGLLVYGILLALGLSLAGR